MNHQTIVDYWFKERSIDESSLSVDYTEAIKRCWRCGNKKKLQKCHIIPKSLGGNCTPSNLVLLCERCHLENPNIDDEQTMWDWLKAYKTVFYDNYWIERGLEEYKKIYSTIFEDDLAIVMSDDFISNHEVLLLLKQIIKEDTTVHFGYRHLNAATIAGALRLLIRNLNNKK